LVVPRRPPRSHSKGAKFKIVENQNSYSGKKCLKFFDFTISY
jgi:hypothetical protein